MDSKKPYVAKDIVRQMKKGQEAIKKANQDRVYLITGREGSGKTLFSLQLAYEIFPELSLDDVCFGYKQLSHRIRTTKNPVVIGDEILSGLSSKSALSKENREIVRLFAECRYRNLTIFLCVPSIFMVEKYMAIFRAHGMFHVQIYKRDFTKRFYKVYNYANKKLLYQLGQKYMSYARPKIMKKYRFYGRMPPTIDEEEYEAKKTKYFREQDEKEKPETLKIRLQRNILMRELNKKYNVTHLGISKMFEGYNCSLKPSAISYNLQNIEKTTKTEHQI